MPPPLLRAALFAKLCWLARQALGHLPGGSGPDLLRPARAQDEAACRAGKDGAGQDDSSWLQHRVNSILRPRLGAKEDKAALERSFVDLVKERGSEPRPQWLGGESSPPRSSSPTSGREPPQRKRETAELMEFLKGVEGHMQHRSFEQCPKKAKAGGHRGAPAKSMVATSGTIRDRGNISSGALSSEALDCTDGYVIGHWEGDDYILSCCTMHEYCAGCAVVADRACGRCASGYVLRADKRCILCDSEPQWKDAENRNCDDYESEGLCKDGLPPANDSIFQGLRPSEACCACGGGQLAATPWQYGVSDQVLTYGSELMARPSPQTATRYEVQPGCTLGELDIALSGDGSVAANSGRLPAFVSTDSGFDTECNITAIENASQGIQYSTKLEVSVQPMSYGPKTIIFSFNGAQGPIGQTTFPLTVSVGLSLQNFEVSCLPAVHFITVDSATGTLSYKPSGAEVGGLSGIFSGFDGGECAVRALYGVTEVKLVFAVLRVHLWEAMQYEVAEVSARVGLPIPSNDLIQSPPQGYGLRRDAQTGNKYWYSLQDSSQQMDVPKALPPQLLDVSCYGGDKIIRWSRQSGAVTIDTQPAFIIDPTSGELFGTPMVDLGGDSGRSTLTVTCHIAAGGFEYAKPLVTALKVDIVDDTCFFPRPNTEPIWAVLKTGLTPSACKAQCRHLADCGGYVFQGPDSCYTLTSGSEGAQLYRPEDINSTINIRTLCQPGRSCLKVESSEVAFLRGSYCPQRTVKVERDGVVQQQLSNIYTRNGMVISDEFFLERNVCPLNGLPGWVVRRPSPSDYEDTATGVTELNGEVVACVANDIETETFNSGISSSVVYLPEEAFSLSQYQDWEARNARGDLTITVSLTSQDCAAPGSGESSVQVTLGTVSAPGAFSLDACECFGEAYSKTAPVTEESAAAVPSSENASRYNSFQPLPQMLLEGPYTCGKEGMLPFGTLGMVTEDACRTACLETEDPPCLFFSYIPDQQHCQLLSSCSSLSSTGLEFATRVFGVFRSSNFCRIADPEACWVQRKRRALLDGSLQGGVDATSPVLGKVAEMISSAGIAGSVGELMPVVCAFQDVLVQCDTLHMASTESPGQCGYCEYFPVDSAAGRGRAKTPPMSAYPSGSQVSVGCDNSDTGSRLLDQGLEIGSAVVDSATYTCVDGTWLDERGEEGLRTLACVSCVQMAQRSYADRLEEAIPAVYFLSRRELEYHFSTKGGRGCRTSSDATAAILRNQRLGAAGSLAFKGQYFQKEGASTILTAVMGERTSYERTWFLSPDGLLKPSPPYTGCLKALSGTSEVRVVLEIECGITSPELPEASHWQFDEEHRLVNLHYGQCLAPKHTAFLSSSERYIDLVLDQCQSNNITQVWFFDGGDCRYQMELASGTTPLTWLYKASGGSYFGAEASDTELKSLDAAIADVADSAVGSCRVSVNLALSLDKPLSLDSLERQLDLANSQGDQIDEAYNLAYALYAAADLAGNSTVLKCYPLDFGGAKAISDLLDQRAQISARLDALRKIEGTPACHFVSCEALIFSLAFALDTLNKQIQAELQDGKQHAICAHDLPMSVETFSKLVAGSLEQSATVAEASSRCGLLHRGYPGDMAGFELTWAQMADVLRDRMYRAEEVVTPTAAPFSSASADPADGVKVGFFAMLDHGATLWGIQCKPGSVVVVNSAAGSPHCVQVQAVEGDVVSATVLPDSATCGVGYAAGGWYNLPGKPVKQRDSGGPADPTGFLLHCRLVPGLARLCDVKYGKCDLDEVVAGVFFETGKSVRYKCCEVPKPVGFSIATQRLVDVGPSEGYYCPAAVGDTGRPQYRPTRLLRAAAPSDAEWWPLGKRQTPVGPNSVSTRMMRCKPGEFLSSWQVHKHGANNSLVGFDCVKLGFPEAMAIISPPPTCSDFSSTLKAGFSARDIDVRCNDMNTGLTGWSLTVLQYNKGFRLDWTCCTIPSGGFFGFTDVFTNPSFRPTYIDFKEFQWSDFITTGPLFACPPFFVMTGFSQSVYAGKWTIRCLPPHLRASAGEGQVLRWNKFQAAWVHDQFPVSIQRNFAQEKGNGGGKLTISAECGALPNSRLVAAVQGWRFVNLGFLLPWQDPKFPWNPYFTSEFRCRGTAVGQCQSHTVPISAVFEQAILQLNIDCGADSVVTSFSQDARRTGQANVLTITCCQAQVTQCHDHDVPFYYPDSDISLFNATCGAGEVLQHLSSQSGRYTFRCCEAPGMFSTVGGFRSVTSQPENDPTDNGVATVTVDAGTSNVEIRLGGEIVNLHVGDSTSLQLLGRVLSPSGLLTSSEIRDLPGDLNVLEDGSVVALGGSLGQGGSMAASSPSIAWALQRCGAQISQQQLTPADEFYAFVGVVGGEALAEATGPTEETLSVTVQVPRPFTVAPIVDFRGMSNPPKKEPPMKPELVRFQAHNPQYNKFCDLQKRTTGLEGCADGHECPDEANPCFHVWQNKITEFQSWGCNQRDVDRTYLEGTAEVQRLQYEAETERIDFYYDLIKLGAKAVSSAAVAGFFGSWGTPASEGAEAVGEGTERAASTAASKLLKAAAKKGNGLTSKEILTVLRKMDDKIAAALKKATSKELKDHAKKALAKPFKAAAERLARKEIAQSSVSSQPFENAFEYDKELRLPDNSTVRAVPKLEEPDDFGFTTARNYDKLNAAGWLDCHPLQWGLSKLACDLYCTEDAVKQGNTAVLQNLEESQDILTGNIERLLEFHSENIIYSLESLKGKRPDAGSLLFKPGKETQGLDLASTSSALRELRALPQLLAMNVSMLRAGGVQKLPSDVAAWHADASERLLDRLHALLERAATEGVPEAVRQAAGMVRQFNASRALRLREPPAHAHDVLQHTSSKKARALRAQVQSQRELLLKASDRAGPLQSAPALGLEDDAVVIRWNQLAGFFVAAHEKHAIFAQSRARALAAAEEVLRSSEQYVSCGQEYGSIQESWRRARRLDDEAASDLLRAWAATVAAQERLQLAVDAGLVDRVAAAASAALHPGEVAGEDHADAVGNVMLLAEEAHAPCGNATLLAEEAHAKGVQKVDAALFPLLQQVIVLERLAKYQEGEIRSKKLQGVARVPTGPALEALARASGRAADPATAAGHALAVRAMERLVPRACRALRRPRELSKKASVISEVVRLVR